ncbi:hypothetical protein DLP05_080 [Stenotrophomonas phage vB_SmaS_DLP_5]|uniref:Uncharacterized protein n=1 Tax=Stenotrophomonas phage vB_SmaS_DLP_5 TaxID=2044561 RepID=A0A2D2W2T1_9CAUD|nr:hypothetical protein FDJ07_gp141 [Stenotrophomonas phage vB_SmaS_DLP_5]ATS92369.1 hypothetical protein DLP05_080 [Stenotrophomonas phage vB_SmaS_DLP_5]
MSDEGDMWVAYAHTYEEAVAKSLPNFPDGGRVESVDRDARLDKYSPGPAPMWELLALAYEWVCLNCGALVNEDLFDAEEERELKPVFDDDMQLVFCCPECAIEYEREQRATFH